MILFLHGWHSVPVAANAWQPVEDIATLCDGLSFLKCTLQACKATHNSVIDAVMSDLGDWD